MTFRVRRKTALAWAPVVMALSACGSDDVGPSTSGADAAAVGAGEGGGGGDSAGGSANGDGGQGAAGYDAGGSPDSGNGVGIDAAGGPETGASTEAGVGEGGPADGGSASEGSAGTEAGSAPDAGGATTGQTMSGVSVPAGWTLKAWDQFGTGGNVTNLQQLHAKYYEAQYYNRDSNGLVTIPNTVINSEQETYSHFESVIAWASDHLTIQARGQSDGSITSGEMVSKYAARSFCTEAKYRIPNVMGSWPAFWFYAAAASGDSSEIDVEQPITPSQGVSEVSMYNHPGQSDVVIADPAFTTQYMTWSKSSFDGSSAPHTYTVCYDDAKSSLARYIDGGLVYTATFKWNQSLGGTGHGPDAATTVNLAVGGSWPGNVSNPSSFKADFDVYWIQYFSP